MSDKPSASLSIHDAVDAAMREPEGQPEAETEEAAPVEAEAETEEAAAEPEEAEAAEDEPEAEDEAPQHLDLDDYGELTIPVKVNGEETRISLAEAAKGYQLHADYTRKSQALAEERKAFEAETTKATEDLNRQRAEIAQLLARQSEPEPDWEKLSQEDPLWYEKKAEWDIRQRKRQAEIEKARTAEAQRIAKLAEEGRQKLFEAVPELANPENAKALIDGAKAYGFAPEEVAAAIDHRILAMAWDAARYRQMQAKNPADKQVRKPPKVVKPGAAKGKTEARAEQDAARRKKLARPHSINDAMKALGFD